ncbi:MAG: type II toxin-antitoxin system death-on-curing family toxin [Chloroflexi bacterium]|nr:type II toxin-antitoxin system death-on-curing family toxin [Chloroflexota bacterium]
MPIDYLSQFDVLQIRTRLAAQVHESFEELNLSSLQSALAAPRQSMFGVELQPTLWDKAAILLTKLIKNHPFYDGNKRIAFIAVKEFLRRNGWDLDLAMQEAAPFTTRIAAGRVDTPEVMAWLQAHSKEQRTENKEQKA